MQYDIRPFYYLRLSTYMYQIVFFYKKNDLMILSLVRAYLLTCDHWDGCLRRIKDDMCFPLYFNMPNETVTIALLADHMDC